ncbi:2-phosphosulfolactate phosphatase [Candidatus Bathyarchaeota archaeon]|nr:2-phosphosulfolactate phosphatase [Candidatus Bathyarchaeota archaeon]
MKIHKYSLIEGVKNVTGTAIIIDVFRAFTTASYVMANGAEKIIPVRNVSEALELKQKNPSWILMGENHGVKIKEFDYGNSPADIVNVDFNNKIVVQRTSSGTQGIILAKKANEIVLGSFVTAGALIKYLQLQQPEEVSFAAMGWEGMRKSIEDELFSQYIEGYLLGVNQNFVQIREDIRNSPDGAKFFQKDQTVFNEMDFHLAMELNKFNFILKVNKAKYLEIHKYFMN